MFKYLLTIWLSSVGVVTYAQKDTLIIKPSDVNTSVLKPGMHRWLVYFKMGKDSSRTNYEIWNRKIAFLQYEGRPAISVTQEWENNDTVTHKVYTVCDQKDFQPLYQESCWRGRNTIGFDFLKKQMQVDGKIPDARDTARANVKRREAFEKALTQYTLDWHLDLEVFPTLPYKDKRTFGINFYDPGFGEPKIVYYTVEGSASLPGYDGQQIDCWLLVHESNERFKNREVFYISKKTKEVLQLDQQFGTRFRYKVKLPFAN